MSLNGLRVQVLILKVAYAFTVAKLTLDEAKTINDKVVEMHKLKRSVALLEGDLKALVK